MATKAMELRAKGAYMGSAARGLDTVETATYTVVLVASQHLENVGRICQASKIELRKEEILID